MTSKVERAKITKSDLNKLYLRSMWGLQLAWNYESMQGLGYCYSIMPILKKLYSDPEELKKAVTLHLGFFNTEPRMSAIIFGADVAFEEEFGMSNPDAITGIKSGLMGPFAGIGDTVMVTIYRTVFYALAAQLAMAGNAAMVFLPVVASFGRNWIRWFLLHLGYDQAKKIATSISTSIKDLTEGAAILGLTVVGALCASVVKANLAVTFTIGVDADGVAVTKTLQSMVNAIMPALPPLIIVLLSYWLLSKKWMTPTKLLLFLLVLGMLLYNLKILA